MQNIKSFVFMIKFIRHMRQKYKICNTEYTICKMKRTRSKKLMTAYFLFNTTLCLKKRHPFYFCDIFVGFHPILLIFGRNIPQEI